MEGSLDRLRPAVLARKVLLPPICAGVAVTCLLAVLALTIASGARTGDPNPLARAPVAPEQLAIGLSLELGFAARLHRTVPAATPSAAERGSVRLTRITGAGRAPSLLATPVAGVVGGCGTFGCPRPGHLHNGVDFLAAAGTPVYAAASGRVALVQSPSRSGGYGKFVCVQHRPALATCYAHLSAVAARARLGSPVRRGQVIGLVGATGSASAPHLHFEVRRGPAGCQQCAVDPLALLPHGAGRSTGGDAGNPRTARVAVAPALTHGDAPAPPPTRGEAPAAAPAPATPVAPSPPSGPQTAEVVQAKPAQPQRIRLPPQPKLEPATRPPAPAPAPAPAPTPAATGPLPATDPAAPSELPAVVPPG